MTSFRQHLADALVPGHVAPWRKMITPSEVEQIDQSLGEYLALGHTADELNQILSATAEHTQAYWLGFQQGLREGRHQARCGAAASPQLSEHSGDDLVERHGVQFLYRPNGLSGGRILVCQACAATIPAGHGSIDTHARWHRCIDDGHHWTLLEMVHGTEEKCTHCGATRRPDAPAEPRR